MAAPNNRAGSVNWGVEFMSLDSLQRQAIKLLSEGHSYAETARIIGRSPATLTKWRNQKNFKRALQHLNDMHADEALAETSSKLALAARKLWDIFETAERDSDKIAAFKQLTIFWDTLRENLSNDIVNELTDRVDQIERQFMEEKYDNWADEISLDLEEAPNVH